MLFSRKIIFLKGYKNTVRATGFTEWTITVEFAENEIIYFLPGSVNKIQYRNFQRYKETDGKVLIFFKDGSLVRIYKDAFVEGSWEECKAMLDSLKAQNTIK